MESLNLYYLQDKKHSWATIVIPKYPDTWFSPRDEFKMLQSINSEMVRLKTSGQISNVLRFPIPIKRYNNQSGEDMFTTTKPRWELFSKFIENNWSKQKKSPALYAEEAIFYSTTNPDKSILESSFHILGERIATDLHKDMAVIQRELWIDTIRASQAAFDNDGNIHLLEWPIKKKQESAGVKSKVKDSIRTLLTSFLAN